MFIAIAMAIANLVILWKNRGNFNDMCVEKVHELNGTAYNPGTHWFTGPFKRQLGPPGAGSGTGTGTGGGNTPGTGGGNTPGTGGGNTPGSGGGNTPGSGGGNTPGTGGGNTPGSGGGNTPGSGGGTRPGSGGGTTPGSGTGSGTTSGTTPGPTPGPTPGSGPGTGNGTTSGDGGLQTVTEDDIRHTCEHAILGFLIFATALELVMLLWTFYFASMISRYAEQLTNQLKTYPHHRLKGEIASSKRAIPAVSSTISRSSTSSEASNDNDETRNPRSIVIGKQAER
ncbi:11029_t:CDS:2 [Paraglomus occultum]|uniref:11029_t:CDS:1 n=1 Tax=Paraglomus occultum TaxID=144539 RepID=A0A9N9B4X9_9GLOM|nr:11029_t:CDS:2 [Paraglomus occultum]